MTCWFHSLHKAFVVTDARTQTQAVLQRRNVVEITSDAVSTLGEKKVATMFKC